MDHIGTWLHVPSRNRDIRPARFDYKCSFSTSQLSVHQPKFDTCNVQGPGEHATTKLRRLLTRVAIPEFVEHRLLILVNSLELAKPQLKAHLTERKEQIVQLQAHAESLP